MRSIFSAVLASVASLSAQAAPTPPASAVPNRILVKFRKGSRMLNVRSANVVGSQLNLSIGSRELGVISQARWIDRQTLAFRFAAGMTPVKAALEANLSKDVEWAQPDYLLSVLPVREGRRSDFSMMSAPEFLRPIFNPFPGGGNSLAADPDYVPAPPLPDTPIADPMNRDAWGLDMVKATDAWKQQMGSTKILVADIDTGVDYTHPDLVNNMWINPSPDPVLKDVVGYDFANNDPKPYDDHGHGTHTSGTIGATGFNGVGLSGVSPRVSIVGIKFITKAGQGTTSDAIRSIDYAISRGVRVMSNSWGGRSDDDLENKALEEAIDRAAKADVLFVAAAGNDGTDNDKDPVYPAAYRLPNVLTVASTTNADRRSFFSNYGKESVHVGAPGSAILSTVPGGKYQKNSGTSMACPHVAGLAALILSERPDLTAVQVKQIIMDTVDPLAALQGMTVTGGRINAAAALRRAKTFGAR